MTDKQIENWFSTVAVQGGHNVPSPLALEVLKAAYIAAGRPYSVRGLIDAHAELLDARCD